MKKFMMILLFLGLFSNYGFADTSPGSNDSTNLPADIRANIERMLTQNEIIALSRTSRASALDLATPSAAGQNANAHNPYPSLSMMIRGRDLRLRDRLPRNMGGNLNPVPALEPDDQPRNESEGSDLRRVLNATFYYPQPAPAAQLTPAPAQGARCYQILNSENMPLLVRFELKGLKQLLTEGKTEEEIEKAKMGAETCPICQEAIAHTLNNNGEVAILNCGDAHLACVECVGKAEDHSYNKKLKKCLICQKTLVYAVPPKQSHDGTGNSKRNNDSEDGASKAENPSANGTSHQGN